MGKYDYGMDGISKLAVVGLFAVAFSILASIVGLAALLVWAILHVRIVIH